MLKATDDRSSHIKNSKNKKVILLNCCTLTYDDVQRYSNNFFISVSNRFIYNHYCVFYVAAYSWHVMY